MTWSERTTLEIKLRMFNGSILLGEKLNPVPVAIPPSLTLVQRVKHHRLTTDPADRDRSCPCIRRDRFDSISGIFGQVFYVLLVGRQRT
jgi:hypothetical protein